MTAEPTAKKPRKKPRKYRTESFLGWKIRLLAPEKWQADNMDYKNRIRHICPSLEAAKTYVNGEQTKIDAQGAGAYALSAAETEEVKKAKKDLAGRATIKQAVAFWLAHHPDKNAATVKEMADGWMQEAEIDGLAPTSIRQNRQRIDSFSREMGDEKACAAITPQDVTDFIAGRDCGKATKKSWQKTLSAFFEYCLEHKAVQTNPVVKKRRGRRGHKPISEVKKQPAFLPVKTVETLMQKAEELHPESVPALAVSFFAGLRPFEISGQYGLEAPATTEARKAVETANETLENAKKRGTAKTIREAEAALEQAQELFAKAREKDTGGGFFGGLDWGNVNLAEKFIRVEADTSKTRKARLVTIPDNLLFWMAKYRKTSGAVAPSPVTLKRHRQDIMEAAGVKRWTPDVARHTYATMHFAKHQNRELLAAQMGHTQGSDILEKHYRGLATPAEAGRFWAIAPAGAEAGNVVQLATAAAKGA